VTVPLYPCHTLPRIHNFITACAVTPLLLHGAPVCSRRQREGVVIPHGFPRDAQAYVDHLASPPSFPGDRLLSAQGAVREGHKKSPPRAARWRVLRGAGHGGQTDRPPIPRPVTRQDTARTREAGRLGRSAVPLPATLQAGLRNGAIEPGPRACGGMNHTTCTQPITLCVCRIGGVRDRETWGTPWSGSRVTPGRTLTS
jgi:hypothetical protein